MSKSKKPEVVSISKQDLADASSSALAVQSNSTPSGIKLASSAFDSAGGEVYSGLNILKLAEGEAAGPFRFTRTVEQEMPAKGKKPAETVTCYCGEHIAYPGREIRMPIATAMVKKFEDAKIAKGDVYLVRRAGDYIDKTYKQTCQGFDLKIVARATHVENLAKLALEYPVQN